MCFAVSSARALSQAGPNEDVTFVVVGQRKAVYGLAKQRKVTTGRVFYREGKLNIIFGKMIDDICGDMLIIALSAVLPVPVLNR